MAALADEGSDFIGAEAGAWLKDMERWPDYTAQGLQGGSQKRPCGCSATIRWI